MNRFFLFALLLFLFSGCSRKVVQDPVEPAEVKVAVPAWYTGPTQESGKSFFGKGSADTMEEATKAALADMKKGMTEKILRTFKEKKRKFGRHLGKNEIESITKRLKRLKISDYEVTRSRCLPGGPCFVEVSVDRGIVARPYKKRVIRRLVPIEESWHAVSGSDILTRYRTAKKAKKKMIALLPEYLFASSIEPFGKSVRSRVEGGISYFARTERSLKKRLSFCVEPAETPALELFSEAVERVLRRENYPVLAWDEAKKDTICIQVEGKLYHDSRADTHLLRASIDLKLREPYKKVIEKRHYVVKGASSQSGIQALYRAKKALERSLATGFPLSE